MINYFRFYFHLALSILMFMLSVLGKAQSFTEKEALDYNLMLKRMKNSEALSFEQITARYEAYLKQNPDDVEIHIQLCQFADLAMYDDYDEYNPNQAYADSCLLATRERFGNQPAILLYSLQYAWGDEKDSLNNVAKNEIAIHPNRWKKEEIASFYSDLADDHYYDEEYESAASCIQTAAKYDSSYTYSLISLQVAVALEQTTHAQKLLNEAVIIDSNAWKLGSWADVCIELGDFDRAMDIYDRIAEIDSNYISNSSLAETLNGMGKHALARIYLLKDTSSWNKDEALRALFMHDLEYHNGDTAYSSFVEFQNIDPDPDSMALYRLQLFLKDPFLPWNLNSFGSFLWLLLIIIILILTPSIWILPIHFGGHRYGWFKRQKIIETNWGLKSFWWVSAAYLLMSLASLIVLPESLYDTIGEGAGYYDYSGEPFAFSTLLFMLGLTFATLTSLYGYPIRKFLPMNWTVPKTIMVSMGYLFVFKFASGIYMKTGMALFDVELDDIISTMTLLLATREDITSLLDVYGLGLTLAMTAVIVPIYEEIIFRGIVLESCTSYLNFKWANILQATLFSAMHGSLFLFPVFLGFGIVAGHLRKRSGSMLAGILFHMVNNLIAVSMLARVHS